MRQTATLLMLLIAGDLRAEGIVVYGTQIKINQDCLAEVTESDGKQVSLDLGLNRAGKCSVINFAETNVPHLERIGRNYLLLVESAIRNEIDCKAEYTAIAFLPGGTVRVSKAKKRSNTCGLDRERGAYEYLSKNMGLM